MANTANSSKKSTLHIKWHRPISRDDFRDPVTSDSRLAEVRLIIGEEERAIERYDAEILRVKGILSGLEDEKRLLEKRIRRCRSYVSPLRRVPVELWEEIFRLSLAKWHPANETQRWPLRFKRPFRLSRVCSRWRNIIISMPSLWSTIFFNLRWDHQKDALGLYLERSQGSSLDIILCAGRGGARPSAKTQEQRKSDAVQLYQTIIHHMARIRSLTTLKPEFGLGFDYADLAPPVETTFSRLEDLSLGDSNYNYPTWFAETVRLAPRLTKLVLKDFENDWHQMIGGSSSVGYIEAHALKTCAPLLKVIPTLRNLESLVTSHRAPSFGDSLSTTVRSNSLLHLSFSAVRTISPVLQALELPNLQTLSLKSVWGMEVDDLGVALARFPSLKSLSLLDVNTETFLSGRLANILRGLPVVSTFVMRFRPPKDGGRVNIAPISKAVSSFYSDLADVPTISPRLKSLDIRVPEADVTGEMIDELIRMLEARGGMGGRDGLKDTFLEGERCGSRGKPKAQRTDRLRHIQAMGVRCAIKHYKNYELVSFFP